MELIPRKRMSSDLLDPKPKKGSFNGVTSDGVFKATGEAIDNILDDGSASETVVVAVPASQSSNYTVGNYYKVHGKVARLRTKTDGDNVTQLTFDTTSGLLDAMNDVVENIASIGSPLQWKGPATVAQLNAGITGIQEGWTYTLTDGGTLTDGSIAVEKDDEVAWTGTAWFKVGGDSGKIAVFEAGERFDDFPTFAQIKAEIANGKTVVIKTSDNEMWYLIRSNSAYCWFQGASEWFVIRVDDSDNWTTPYQYDDFLSSQSYNAVQNRVLWNTIGSVKNGGSVAQGDGYASVENNSLTTITGVNVAALQVSVSFDDGSTEVPNFALEIDPTVDCTLTIKKYVGSSPLTLTPSVAGGNVMTAGKHYQVTCVGSCWTLAEFAMPNP